MSLYTDTIRNYATDTRYIGALEHADGVGEVGLGRGEAGTRLAVRFALQVRDERVETVRFQVFGCGFTIAACTAAAELAEGCLLVELEQFSTAAIEERLGGMPKERDYCARLALDALLAAAASAGSDGQTQQTTGRDATTDHLPQLPPDDPLRSALLASVAPDGMPPADRELLAGLLAVAVHDATDPAGALGLSADEFTTLCHSAFPAADPHLFAGRANARPPAANPEIFSLLLGYVTADASPLAVWLAKALATRAACPGHLWVAMGLPERPQLSAAIRRHLPALFAANNRNMRWKRFFFKQLCDRSGGNLCQNPDCGTCSDHDLCFAPED
jgi:nitrogen fixation protein NifQ